MKAGEIAYSYSSNNFFIGTPDGTSSLPVGGYNTYTAVNNSTNANTGSTIVKRAADGSFSGQLFGNANTATALQTARNFSISGSDITAPTQSFDGTAAVVLNAALNTVSGLTGGIYGSSLLVPVLGIAANGRIMNVTTSSISTSFNVAGNTGTTTAAGGSVLTYIGNTNSGITTTVTSNGTGANVIFSTDTTILRSNTTAVGPQTISTDLTVTGNLFVVGSQSIMNTVTLSTVDSMIKLAANNGYADVFDIGFYGMSNINTTAANSNVYHGLIRQGSGGTNAGDFYLFKNLGTDPTGNVITYASLTQANLRANIIATNANVTNFGVSGTANIATLGVSGVTNTAYLGVTTNANIAALGISGTANIASLGATTAYIGTLSLTNPLAYASGGTGATSYTTGALLVAGVSAIQSLANTTFTVTGTAAANNTVTSQTVDAYGRHTATTYSAISGLTVAQGGTGNTTFASNGMVFGNTTGALNSTAVAGSASDQTWSNQILTVTNAGVPVWSSAMDGGTF